ncbi:MAG: hypothetical protein JNL57_06440 [Bacteroidetes bacterium]|nr:hypothetical protein [Bacteroidota bacterium]
MNTKTPEKETLSMVVTKSDIKSVEVKDVIESYKEVSIIIEKTYRAMNRQKTKSVSLSMSTTAVVCLNDKKAGGITTY